MEGLVPNPDGCRFFEPNVFRRQKCKHCGHPWQSHQGCLTPAQLRAFTGAKQQEAEKRRIAEEVQKAKAQAKAKAKTDARRATRAVEDGWLCDNDDADDSGTSGDDDGFRMVEITGTSASASSHSAAGAWLPQMSAKPAMLRNLIDFESCNVLCGDPVAGGGGASSSSSSFPPTAPRAQPAQPARPAASAQHASAEISAVHVTPTQHVVNSTASAANAAPTESATSDFVELISRTLSSSLAGLPTSLAVDSAAATVNAAPAANSTSPLLGGRQSSLSRPRPFTMPMQSKDDVLMEEVQYLRQMLEDSNELKKIQAAITRDEVQEKQRNIDELARQLAEAGVGLRPGNKVPLRDSNELGVLNNLVCKLQMQVQDQQVAYSQLDESEQALRERCNELERSGEAIRSRLGKSDAERQVFAKRLVRLDAPQEALDAVTTEMEIMAWQKEFRAQAARVLERLDDRRVALRVAALQLQDVTLCKICFDRPAACALLPCKHHAFCVPCAERVQRSRDPTCPLCRTRVCGLFETYVA